VSGNLCRMDATTTPRLRQVHRRAGEVRTPGEPLRGVRRIVVVRDDRMGDVLLSLPAVDALRHAYPDARIALMLRAELQPLGRMVQGIDEILVADGSVGRCRRRLLEFGTDLLVCVSRGVTLPLAGALAGVRHRVGTGYRFYSALFTRRVGERRRAGERHELEYALSFAHRSGAPGGAEKFPIAVPEPARADADSWLRTRGVPDRFVLLHPGTGGSCPPWPAERYVALASSLTAGGIGVVVTIGPADSSAGRAFESAPGPVRELPRAAPTLETMAGMIRRAAVVVSNSTGPLHLATALGVPVLGLFAPWTTCGASRWGPYAANGWAIEADSSQALEWSRSRRRRDGRALLSTIPTEFVARAVVAMSRGEAP